MSYTHQINSKTSVGLRNLVFVVTLMAVLLSSTASSLVFDAVNAQNSASQSATLQGTVEATTDEAAGLDRVIITHRNGVKSFVNLPNGVRAGETISGTVIAQASGKTAEERAASLAELKDQFIEISGHRVAATGGIFEIAISKGGNDYRDPCGPIVIWGGFRERFPCGRGPFDPGPVYFSLPAYGQIGRPIEIRGPFDGKFGPGDHVKVGKHEMMQLAQSPRKTIFFNTSPVVGPTEITVKEQGTVQIAAFRNVEMDISADRLALRKGERTTVRFSVKGLRDLKEPILAQLTNHSPNTITMDGGNAQTLRIARKDVKPDGVYETQRTLISTQAGAFVISGSITWKGLGEMSLDLSDRADIVSPSNPQDTFGKFYREGINYFLSQIRRGAPSQQLTKTNVKERLQPVMRTWVKKVSEDPTFLKLIGTDNAKEALRQLEGVSQKILKSPEVLERPKHPFPRVENRSKEVTTAPRDIAESSYDMIMLQAELLDQGCLNQDQYQQQVRLIESELLGRGSPSDGSRLALQLTSVAQHTADWLKVDRNPAASPAAFSWSKFLGAVAGGLLTGAEVGALFGAGASVSALVGGIIAAVAYLLDE